MTSPRRPLLSCAPSTSHFDDASSSEAGAPEGVAVSVSLYLDGWIDVLDDHASRVPGGPALVGFHRRARRGFRVRCFNRPVLKDSESEGAAVYLNCLSNLSDDLSVCLSLFKGSVVLLLIPW